MTHSRLTLRAKINGRAHANNAAKSGMTGRSSGPTVAGGADDRADVAGTLARLLSGIRLDSAFFFSVEARAPWATLTPRMDNIGHLVMPQAHRVLPFHVMLEGAAWCWKADAPAEVKPFRTGDILLLPQGHDHVIASARSSPRPPDPDTAIYARAAVSGRPCTFVDLGGDGAPCRFVCGYFGLPGTVFHPLFEGLPDLTVLSLDPIKQRMLAQLVEVATQAQTLPAGDGSLLTQRLAETLFVDALQIMLREGPEMRSGLLAGLQDSRLAAALALIHDRPGEALSLQVLARTAGLSRSVFAQRFRDLVGTTPARYLQRWRVQLAAEALSRTDRNLQTIAEAVGYGSETAFFRAFKRETGMTPAAWRAQCAEADPAQGRASRERTGR